MATTTSTTIPANDVLQAMSETELWNLATRTGVRIRLGSKASALRADLATARDRKAQPQTAAVPAPTPPTTVQPQTATAPVTPPQSQAPAAVASQQDIAPLTEDHAKLDLAQRGAFAMAESVQKAADVLHQENATHLGQDRDAWREAVACLTRVAALLRSEATRLNAVAEKAKAKADAAVKEQADRIKAEGKARQAQHQTPAPVARVASIIQAQTPTPVTPPAPVAPVAPIQPERLPLTRLAFDAACQAKLGDAWSKADPASRDSGWGLFQVSGLELPAYLALTGPALHELWLARQKDAMAYLASQQPVAPEPQPATQSPELATLVASIQALVADKTRHSLGNLQAANLQTLGTLPGPDAEGNQLGSNGLRDRLQGWLANPSLPGQAKMAAETAKSTTTATPSVNPLSKGGWAIPPCVQNVTGIARVSRLRSLLGIQQTKGWTLDNLCQRWAAQEAAGQLPPQAKAAVEAQERLAKGLPPTTPPAAPSNGQGVSPSKPKFLASRALDAVNELAAALQGDTTLRSEAQAVAALLADLAARVN